MILGTPQTRLAPNANVSTCTIGLRRDALRGDCMDCVAYHGSVIYGGPLYPLLKPWKP